MSDLIYRVCKRTINRGGYPADMATRLDVFYASGALTTGTDTKADLLATQQGILALTGKTYATIGEPAAAAPSAPATTEPTATPAPAPAAPSGTDPAVAWSVGVLVLASAGVVAVTAARGRRS